MGWLFTPTRQGRLPRTETGSFGRSFWSFSGGSLPRCVEVIAIFAAADRQIFLSGPNLGGICRYKKPYARHAVWEANISAINQGSLWSWKKTLPSTAEFLWAASLPTVLCGFKNSVRKLQVKPRINESIITIADPTDAEKAKNSREKTGNPNLHKKLCSPSFMRMST